MKPILRANNIYRFAGMGFSVLMVLCGIGAMFVKADPLKVNGMEFAPWQILFGMGLLGQIVGFWPQVKEIWQTWRGTNGKV